MQRSVITALLAAAALFACKDEGAKPAQPATGPAPSPASAPAPAPAPAPATTELDPAVLGMFKPLPAVMDGKEPLTEERITLGRQLYFDKRLSKNHDLSCNSCHVLSAYGVDNKPTSPGHKGQLGTRNSPTVYNAAGHFAQFWDGRAADVEAQAVGPVTNPVEMAVKDPGAAEAVLKSIPEYVAAFKAAFPADKDPVTLANAGKAIGAFERKLVTPDKFDKFLGGDKTALNDEEKKGLKTFTEVGCTACHAGAYLGGAMFQKLGLVKPWPDTKDQGRFQETKNEADKMMFKVPSLRNIEKTGPYFHDGKVATLEEATRLMAEYQLGRALSDEQVKSIVTFLKALTGELPTAYIAEPKLPASTKTTPKADPN